LHFGAFDSTASGFIDAGKDGVARRFGREIFPEKNPGYFIAFYKAHGGTPNFPITAKSGSDTKSAFNPMGAVFTK
jgi:hypothetical protein